MVAPYQLEKLFPGSKDFVDPINKAINTYKIKNVALFLAQLGHESMGLKTLVENFNYSEKRLLEVFPKYFNATTARKYARRPDAIANRVYANRMGNGPESSGDGWKYRGKGAIQLTGKDTHAKFAASINKSINDTIAYLLTPEGAIMSAGWFWSTKGLNNVTTVEASTRIINGGFNGLDDRKKWYKKAKAALIS